MEWGKFSSYSPGMNFAGACMEQNQRSTFSVIKALLFRMTIIVRVLVFQIAKVHFNQIQKQILHLFCISFPVYTDDKIGAKRYLCTVLKDSVFANSIP